MAKKGNGEGSIIRREDELYVGRFYMETPNGNVARGAHGVAFWSEEPTATGQDH
jgi:hypothetical protein